MVNVSAWALWDTRTGEPAPGSRVVEAKRLLDGALATEEGRRHPGVLHLYLHAMEMSARPEDALPAADLLRGLVPDAGHLQHMPSHIDVLCGDYRRSIDANQVAVQADRKFVEREGPLNFYSLYRAHDLHFVVYSAMFDGRYAAALQAADELAGQLTPELLSIESPPMADWLEAFAALRVHVLIRFGRWDDLIAHPLPDDVDLYCTTAATIYYGRGIAHAAKGELDRARAERAAFDTAYARIPDTRYLFNNTGRDILAVARAMLDGEIAYRAGSFEEAFEHLRRAIALDDALPYDEPWGWMQPVRHAYGALLLEQDRVEEAAAVYAADLGLDPTLSRCCQHPGNVWSLHGYHECLTRLGPRRRGRRRRSATGGGEGPGGRPDRGIVRVPARRHRRLLRRGVAHGRPIRAAAYTPAVAISNVDLGHLRRCVELAAEAQAAGDEPFGSVLVDAKGVVRLEARNRIKEGAGGGDATRHPEFEIARWAASNLAPDERAAATVYTSGEHCPMCAAAHAWVGLGRIVYAASTAQLVGWLQMWGVSGPAVAPLPITTIAPGVDVAGPAPELAEEMKAIYEGTFRR